MVSTNKRTFRRVMIILMCVILMLVTLSGCFAPPADTGSASGDGAAADGTASSGGGWMVMIIYLVIIILVFYFLMIRPEKKRKKKAQEMRDSLSVGDNIVTIGGMVGKIVNVSGDYVTFETGEDRVRIKIAKWGISSTGKDTEEPVEKAGE